MKRIIITATILLGFGSSYAQQDLINTLGKQAITIDSLEKVIITYQVKTSENLVNIKNLQDSISILNKNMADYEKLKSSKIIVDEKLKQQSDSITLLISNLTKNEQQIVIEKQKREQEVKEAKERIKDEALSAIVSKYKNKTFDDLIKSSNKQSIQTDMQVLNYRTDLKPILLDLERYFIIKELLEIKYDDFKVKNSLSQLNLIKYESVSINKFKKVVENYQIFNNGIKETIGKIIALDQKEMASGMPEEIKKQKRNKIIAEISIYIFNYDFKFEEYPYLAEILLEIVKRKQPNPDADVSDLLAKL